MDDWAARTPADIFESSLPYDHLLAFPEPQCGKVDVLKELRNCHEIDETVPLLSAGSVLPSEALSEEKVRYEMWRIRFHDRKNHQWQDDVAGDWRWPCHWR